MDEKRKRLAAAKQKLQQYKKEKQKTQEPGIHSPGTNSCSSSVHNKSEESLASLIADDEENQISHEVPESSLNLNISNSTVSSYSLIDSSSPPLTPPSHFAELLLEPSRQEKEVEFLPSQTSVLMISGQREQQLSQQYSEKNDTIDENLNPTLFSVPDTSQLQQVNTIESLTLPAASSVNYRSPPEIVPIDFYTNSQPRFQQVPFNSNFMGAQTTVSQISPPVTVILQEQEVELQSSSYSPKEGDKETVENSTQSEDLSENIPPKKDEMEEETKQLPNYIVDSLQKELSVLRKENAALASRESELVEQLETSEKLMRDLRKEVNQFKQQGNVHQQLEELQQAVIVLSKSKMTIAEELNNEQDKNKELLDNLGTYENELKSLRAENSQLYQEVNVLKSKLEEELIRNQTLDDQRRHFGVLVETLQTKLNSVEQHNCSTDVHSHEHSHDGESKQKDSHSHEHSHSHSDCQGHSHDHDQDHQVSNGQGHSHNHDHHDDHKHGHGHDHHDHDGHHHDHSSPGHAALDADSDVHRKLTEMEKTLKRLEWENSTYEAELMRLGPLKQLEPRVLELQTKNASLKEEVDRLDHLVVQLQGENDTIGDYITLYQTQRLALREHAKENDQLVAALAKEKNALLQKLSELNHSVEELARKQSEAQSQNQSQLQNGSVLEDKIRNLIVDVNSKVHETYSCSVCSGSRLMTV